MIEQVIFLIGLNIVKHSFNNSSIKRSNKTWLKERVIHLKNGAYLKDGTTNKLIHIISDSVFLTTPLQIISPSFPEPWNKEIHHDKNRLDFNPVIDELRHFGAQAQPWWTINIRHITVSHLLKAHPPRQIPLAYDVMAVGYLWCRDFSHSFYRIKNSPVVFVFCAAPASLFHWKLVWLINTQRAKASELEFVTTFGKFPLYNVNN